MHLDGAGRIGGREGIGSDDHLHARGLNGAGRPHSRSREAVGRKWVEHPASARMLKDPTGMFGHNARTFILSEPTALAAELPCRSVRAVPLRCGPMTVHIARISLGDILLQTVRSTPLAVLGTLPRSAVVLALPFEGYGTALLNGRAVRPHCVATFGAGAGYEMASPRDCTWAMLVLPSATISTLLGRRSLPPALRPGVHAVLSVSPAAWARAEALARDACEVAAQDPDIFETEEVRRALRFELLEALDELLASPTDDDPARNRQARAAHRRLVRLVDDLVTANPSRIAGVAELSSALGVSERHMRHAFVDVLGMSPSRYLRLRRLVLVRGALRSQSLSGSSVREAALAHGFWHVGRFARLYHNAFGEPPSTTLESASGRAAVALAK